MAAVLAATSCNTRAMFVPPSVPGTPAPEADRAFAEATAGCRSTRSYVAALRVSGRVGSDRLWPIAIDTALRADDAVYLGATAAGQSLFVLAGSGEDATLWLRREQRTVIAPPSGILEAIVGLTVAPSQLLAVLSGCVARTLDLSSAERQGRFVVVQTPDARLFLAQVQGRWQVTAAQTRDFVVEVRARAGGLPQDLWIWSAAGVTPTVALHVTAHDAEVNGTVPERVFDAPAGAARAEPMTLDELRAAAPWRNRSPEVP
jgi:hypothetical protein